MAKTDGQYDQTELRLLKEHAATVLQNHSQRVRLCEQMEEIYWMDWKEEAAVKKQIDNVKITKSPRGRIALLGAERLLIAADPQIIVPKDINRPDVMTKADKLERFAKAMWFASGRVSGDPIHYDVVRSGLLYSDVHIRITPTDDLVEYMKGSSSAALSRAEYVAEKTPYLFEVENPKTGFPEFGRFGLHAFYKRVQTTSGSVLDDWGSRAEDALNEMSKGKEVGRYTTVYLNDFYDFKKRVVWVDGSDRPICLEDHGLDFIPVVAQIVEGSRLFDKEDKRREPFLYTLYKSGMINRQNLFLTVFYSLIFALGANPMFVNYLMDPDNPPETDYSVPGGQVNMRVGERREPMIKQVIDPSMMQGWTIANELEQESTIYRQTLGEPLGMNAPYSMVALLSQSGRLPLTATQRKSGWAISEAMDIALRWAKKKSKQVSAEYAEYSAILNPEDIPEHFEIEARLEITLPQDRLNAANAANALAAGESPMVSKEWVRENVLNIGQSDAMTQQIWGEQAAEMFFQQFQYQMMASLAAMKQAAIQPGAASGVPGSPPVPPGSPGQGSLEQPQPVSPVEPLNPMEPYAPLPPTNQGLT